MKMLVSKNRIPIIQIITIGLLPSFLKKILYKIKGYDIGRNVNLALGSIIVGKSVKLGDNVKIGFFTVIRAKTIIIDRYVTIGAMSFLDTKSIEIGEDTRIREQVYIHGLSGPNSLFKIGKKSIIQMSFINPVEPIIIGDNVAIGGHALLFTHGSWLSQLEGFPVNFAPINIGNNVYIAWRVTIIPGVNIGDNVVVGAHSLVNKNIQSNTLVGGCPAKVIKENYPNKPSIEEQNEMIEKIIFDFTDYLKYEYFNVLCEELNCGLRFLITKKKRKYEILYLKEISENINITVNNLLILNINNFTGENCFENKYKMIINMKKNTRKGSSIIGEEFAYFISRYGIRFNRVD